MSEIKIKSLSGFSYKMATSPQRYDHSFQRGWSNAWSKYLSTLSQKKATKIEKKKKNRQKVVASVKLKSLRRVPTTEAVYHGKSDQFSIHNRKLWNKFVKFQNFWKPTESMLCSLLCRSEIKYVYCYQLSGHCCPKQQEWLVSECFNIVKMCDTSNYLNVQLMLHFCHISNIRFFPNCSAWVSCASGNVFEIPHKLLIAIN